MDKTNVAERFKQLEKEIQNAEVEVGVRQQQLTELSPKKAQLEQECESEFNCSHKDLADLLEEKSAEFERLVDKLESDIAAAKANNG